MPADGPKTCPYCNYGTDQDWCSCSGYISAAQATMPADPTPPITAMWPLRDDADICLIPGNWTRGRATAWAADELDVPFTQVRTRRVYFRWEHHATPMHVSGWEFPDGMLTGCEKGDQDAERYWESIYAPMTRRRPLISDETSTSEEER